MSDRWRRSCRWIARSAGTAAAFLFPSTCFGCGRALGSVHRLGACAACWASLSPIAAPSCVSCGLPLPRGSARARCGRCAASPPPFDRTVAAVVYRGFARSVVLRVKTGHRAELLEVMAEQLALTVRTAALARSADAVVPVPGRPLARLVRGFDHADLLARRVAFLLGLPVRRDILRATLVGSTPLKTLGAAARRVAASHSLAARGSARGLRVLLIDDVLTTGATAGAAARALAGAGARSVEVGVWARTPEPAFDLGWERPV